TEAVREIIATQIIVDIPKEEHVQQPAFETPLIVEIPASVEVTTISEDRFEPVAAKEEQLLEATFTSAAPEIVEESTNEDQKPAVTEATTEETDHVSTEALTKAVREIIARSGIPDVPTEEHVEQRTIAAETITEEPSSETIAEIKTEIEEIESSLFGTPDEEKPESVDTQHDDKQELHTTPTHIETTEDITPQIQQPGVTEPTTELADHVSTEALTEAVREIIATQIIVDIPKEEHVQQPAFETP
ncbi:unnamed protein product, partial [Rotaria socialis]